MGGHISPTLDSATDISIKSSPGLRLELSVWMWMEVILFPSTTWRPIPSCIHFPRLLLIITTLPGLEQGGLMSTVTGGGAMEAPGTTATGALGNPLIWELMIMAASMEERNLLICKQLVFGTTQTRQMMKEEHHFFVKDWKGQHHHHHHKVIRNYKGLTNNLLIISKTQLEVGGGADAYLSF